MVEGRGSGGAGGGSVGDTLGSLPRWWLAELRGLVPDSLKARTVAAPAAFGCSLFEDGSIAFARLTHAKAPLPGEAEAMAPSELLAAHVAALVGSTGRRSVRLSVPVSLCLVRRTRIPGRALSHAGAILKAEIEELMPLAAADLLSDWYVEAEDPATRELQLVQVVLARSRIAGVAELLGGAGLTLTRLTVGEAEGRMMPVDLMDGRDPTLGAFLARLPRRSKAVVALAALLVLAAPFVVAARQEAALAELSLERAVALSPGAAARAASAVADALESFGRQVPVAYLLDDIATRLPSNVHLTRFQFGAGPLGKGQFVLSTEGGDAAKTRAALAASPFFASVEAMEGAVGTLVLTLPAPSPRGALPGPGA
ncbi:MULTISPECIES: hypothetical protein [unclassified Aureimonas]|uniref:hypothetical protein n=1 Tax=unclassified Aureimonas TaxID=2615206 RepID=UPI0006FF3F99|nr:MULTISPECIES: hypothetical protein [unclassified Aureimonas]KQT69875.1 hypothetical protein ASG62_01870 [Aureimonas sp. Leaf427]KQT75971.1 hypothetical protein ASG54_14350 [Aureimonas sp. Leaf460]